MISIDSKMFEGLNLGTWRTILKRQFETHITFLGPRLGEFSTVYSYSKGNTIIMYESLWTLTGVKSSGVADGDDNSVVKLMPDPRSKSHILIGHNFSVETHRIFSGFKSRWAIPFLWRKSKPDAISLIIWAASCSEKRTYSWIRVSRGPPLIYTAQNSARKKDKAKHILDWWKRRDFSYDCSHGIRMVEQNFRFYSNEIVPSRTPNRIYLHLRRTRSIEEFQDDLGNDGMSPLHERHGPVHGQESCQLFSRHIPNLCKYLHMFERKHMRLLPKYHPSTCTTLLCTNRK